MHSLANSYFFLPKTYFRSFFSSFIAAVIALNQSKREIHDNEVPLSLNSPLSATKRIHAAYTIAEHLVTVPLALALRLPPLLALSMALRLP